MTMNLPNKLTIMRIIMVPFFILFMFLPFYEVNTARIIGCAIFVIASLTDMLDGKIARKYNLITDFGKFLDPLADKILVITAFICAGAIDTEHPWMQKAIAVTAAVIVFRELAVSGLRLVVASSPDAKVVAAAWLGKVKTVTQMVTVVVMLLEPVIFNRQYYVTPYLLAATAVMTLWSGADYFRVYWGYIDPEK